jgi:hypothetical protein
MNINQVVSYGYPFDEFAFTYALATGIVAADVDKAVTQDTGAANKMKLAGNGNPVHGRLLSVEELTAGRPLVGTVERKFKAKFKKTAAAVALGDGVCGSATAGLVRTAVPGTDPVTNIVVELLADDFIVVESL